MAGEKSEKATPKRKKDERKKGNVFLSNEIITVFSLLASFYTIKLLGPTILSQLENMVKQFFVMAEQMSYVSTDDLSMLFIKGVLVFFISALPVMLVASLVAIVLTMAQTKMLFSAKSFEFKASRLNPLNGIKKMFSLRGIIELVKSILKIIVLAVIVWNVISDWVVILPKMMDMTAIQVIRQVGETIISIVLNAVIIFAVLAIFDYIYQWWEYERNLRMSKQEIKEEYKQMEGDPQIKGKIKDRQQRMAQQRMMQNVPSADVVIRNPTHYAVAIKYDPHKNNAPMVVAKGVDSLALRIVDVAEKNDVYVMENRPLARGLYESVDLEREIPEKYYKAVAEVLAFVYNLKKKDLK